MFKPLTRENIGGIVDLIINNLNERLAVKELKFSLTPVAKKYVADNGYDPVYGARPLKRYLQKNVETLAAKVILEGKVSLGDTIVFDVEGDKLVVK
mgnify:FL=1